MSRRAISKSSHFPERRFKLKRRRTIHEAGPPMIYLDTRALRNTQRAEANAVLRLPLNGERQPKGRFE
jgi:hypothetical protein